MLERKYTMENKKAIHAIIAVTVVILSIFLWMFFSQRAIEADTWELASAIKIGEPFPVVAHGSGTDTSDKMYLNSKEVELICTAKDGKITLTDKTNNKVYEGTYKCKWRYADYECVIDGKSGDADVSFRYFNFWDGYSLNIQIGDYTLIFFKK